MTGDVDRLAGTGWELASGDLFVEGVGLIVLSPDGVGVRFGNPSPPPDSLTAWVLSRDNTQAFRASATDTAKMIANASRTNLRLADTAPTP